MDTTFSTPPSPTAELPPSHFERNERLHRAIIAKEADPQLSSPLMTQLPPEVRNEIFKLALTEYVDPNPTARYQRDTPFTRPAYSAPRRTDTELLATCRAIYRDCWLMPHILKEETHWLAWPNRRPPEYEGHITQAVLRRRLEAIARNLQWEKDRDKVMEMSGLRVFAQLCELEDGRQLRDLVGIPHLRFRRLTVTLRHTDWWHWESQEPLQMHTCRWVQVLQTVLPPSVTEVYMELESLEQQKKAQVDVMAELMSQRWFFQRTDGVCLFADTTAIPSEDGPPASGGEPTASEDKGKQDRPLKRNYLPVHRWSGSSTFDDQTWSQDEAAPGRLDYYVLTVPFRLQHVVEARGGQVHPDVLRAARDNDWSAVRRPLVHPSMEHHAFFEPENDFTDDEDDEGSLGWESEEE